MSQKHTTVCDNCGAQTESAAEWSKINVHPWESRPPDDDPDSPWLIRDLCPKCAAKVRAWLQGELAAVFRKPRRFNVEGMDIHHNTMEGNASEGQE